MMVLARAERVACIAIPPLLISRAVVGVLVDMVVRGEMALDLQPLEQEHFHPRQPVSPAVAAAVDPPLSVRILGPAAAELGFLGLVLMARPGVLLATCLHPEEEEARADRPVIVPSRILPGHAQVAEPTVAAVVLITIQIMLAVMELVAL